MNEEDDFADSLKSVLAVLGKIALRAGVPYSEFEDIAKSAFVVAAKNEGEDSAESLSSSQISARTGISRREIRRVLQEDTEPVSTSQSKLLAPAQVIDVWRRNPRFNGADGQPGDLPYTSKKESIPSFVELVKLVPGDSTPAAVRKELERALCIESVKNGQLRLTDKLYVNPDEASRLAYSLKFSLTRHLETIFHNTSTNDPNCKYLDLHAHSNAVPEEYRAAASAAIQKKLKNQYDECLQLLELFESEGGGMTNMTGFEANEAESSAEIGFELYFFSNRT